MPLCLAQTKFLLAVLLLTWQLPALSLAGRPAGLCRALREETQQNKSVSWPGRAGGEPVSHAGPPRARCRSPGVRARRGAAAGAVPAARPPALPRRRCAEMNGRELQRLSGPRWEEAVLGLLFGSVSSHNDYSICQWIMNEGALSAPR